MVEALDVIASLDALDGPQQMALDEVLLGSVRQPTLRFYRWSDPWVSFGYFQSHREVTGLHPEWHLVRRWTGGGIVVHDGDITFSLMIPSTDPLAVLPPSRFYALLHGKLMTLIGGGLAGEGDIVQGAACFSSPSRDDVMVSGSKVMGGALRRSRGALLYQGSLCLSSGDDFLKRMMEGIPRVLAAGPRERALLHKELLAAHQLAESKYASREWNERR